MQFNRMQLRYAHHQRKRTRLRGIYDGGRSDKGAHGDVQEMECEMNFLRFAIHVLDTLFTPVILIGILGVVVYAVYRVVTI
jgi:hypothetical protein